MLTNPNTLGLFDENIVEIAELVHEAGGLLYYDGANLNADPGHQSRPGDMGFDVVHFNLHKTFTTPHGGGGPGAGPIVVRDTLAPFLPGPLVATGRGRPLLPRRTTGPQSIGKVRTFYGNFGVLVRAYTYIRALGARGPARASARRRCSTPTTCWRACATCSTVPVRPALHARVRRLGDAAQAEHGVRALDVAKRLLDYGVHPPTIYFPLIVDEALMIEPTETESREDLDRAHRGVPQHRRRRPGPTRSCCARRR